MKLKLKIMKLKLNCGYAHSLTPALALLVALGTLTTESSLFAKDQEGKDKNREPQSTLQSGSESRADEREDLNAKTNPEKFISHVAQSGIKEIRLANLAKQRAQSQEVKQFAERLIQDHTKANQELKLIAQHQNIPWDAAGEKTPAAASGTARSAGTVDNPVVSSPANSAADGETPAVANGTARGAYSANEQGRNVQVDQDDSYERLVNLTGKSFDEAYLNHEVVCHTTAVAKFEKANRDLPDGELKQFVQSTLPTLREHLAMAQRMAPVDPARRSDHESNRKLEQDQASK
jgi:putative membrane protein